MDWEDQVVGIELMSEHGKSERKWKTIDMKRVLGKVSLYQEYKKREITRSGLRRKRTVKVSFKN